MPGKCLKFGQKVRKTWNFNSKSGNNLTFVNSVFQDSFFKMSFTQKYDFNFVISTLSTQTLIQSQIDLGFHCFYLEITWKIYGILCRQRSKNPVIRWWHRTLFFSSSKIEYEVRTHEVTYTFGLNIVSILISICTWPC